MPDADRLDRALHEAGERWRASQPPLPPLGQLLPPTVRATGFRPGWLMLAATVTVAVVLAAGVLSVAAPRPTVQSHVGISWNADQLRAAAVHDGDAVTATGMVVALEVGSARICLGGASFLMPNEPPPSCQGSRVPGVDLLGLDPSLLPDWKSAPGEIYAYASVRGTWAHGAIRVTSVSTGRPSYEFDPSAPFGECPAPQAGWVQPATAVEFRTALNPLVADIAAHPELFAGYETRGGGGLQVELPMVELVRTRVDPATLQARVEALFPYAVCLVGENPKTAESAVVLDGPTVSHFLDSGTIYPDLFVRKVAAGVNVSSLQPSIGPASPIASDVQEPPPSVPLTCPASTDYPTPSLPTGSMALPSYLAWFGSPKLWTIVPKSGTGSWWTGSESATGGVFIRTFWYSADWTAATEPDSRLTVLAGRLGGGESVEGGPVVVARSHELGTAMIVGLDLPSGGCWQIEGAFGGVNLTYEVWVPTNAPGPLPTLSPEGLRGEAHLMAQKFEGARSVDDASYLDVAWNYLSLFSQRQVGSEAAFVDAERAYNAAGGANGDIGEPVLLSELPADRLSAFSRDLLDDVAASVDPARAFVVTVLHPRVDGASGGSRTYVVGQLSDTEWRIWIVH